MNDIFALIDYYLFPVDLIIYLYPTTDILYYYTVISFLYSADNELRLNAIFTLSNLLLY